MPTSTTVTRSLFEKPSTPFIFVLPSKNQNNFSLNNPSTSSPHTNNNNPSTPSTTSSNSVHWNPPSPIGNASTTILFLPQTAPPPPHPSSICRKVLLVIPQQPGMSAKAKGERENMFPAEANAIGQEDGPSKSFRRGLQVRYRKDEQR